MQLSDSPTERRHVRGIIAFVVGYVVVDLLPIALPEARAVLGLRIGDLADFALIFLLAALYVHLAMRANLLRTGWLWAGFSAALAMMVQGHSVHRTADAIGFASVPGAPGWSLTYFLDEHWGHVELHLSFILIAALFIAWAEAAGPHHSFRTLSRVEKIGLVTVTVVYGILLAGDAVEGQTVPLLLPAAIVLAAWAFWPYVKRGSRLAGAPTISVYRRFFGASFGIASVTLLIFGSVIGGFPELTSLLPMLWG